MTRGLTLITCAATIAGVGTTVSAQQMVKPNIVVILVDDMGYSDIGCYGGEIETPNLDMLAEEGLMFRQFYNSARCSPTRASLLTGVHPHQAGIGHMAGSGHDISEHYQGYLNNSVVTIAEVLKADGYFTAMSGKWHVGRRNASMKPLGRGFDRSYEGQGFYYGSDMKGQTLELNGELVTDLDESWYSSTKWAEYGTRFINEAIEEDKPFFLYLSFNAPHWPLQAPDSVISKYLGRYKEGWSSIRQERLTRQKEIGLIDSNIVNSPDDDRIVSWASLDYEQKLFQDSIMAAYAACVDMMDHGVGILIDSLIAKGVFDNTLIMFLSDNGACAEGPNTGLGNNTGSGPVGSDVSFVRCGQGWANAQNTPYREYKHWTHEGGIRTPFIVHWPDGFSAKGEFRDEPGHIIDIMATIVDATGATYPETYKGNDITPMEGLSLLPVFKGMALDRDTLYWEHEANRGIRVKNMKLVARTEVLRVFADTDRGKWELYDLENDPTEVNNLAELYPEMVKQLKAAWDRWAIEKGILPWPWGIYFEMDDTEGDLFFYYPFDGHSEDYTGHTAVISGNVPPFVLGKYGQAIGMNGSDHFLEVSSEIYSHLNVARDKFTLCAWVYNYPGSEDIQTILSQTDLGGTGRIFLERLGSNQQYMLSSFLGGSRSQSTGSGIQLNNWHHLAITGDFEHNEITFYLDGKQNGNSIYTREFESNSGNFVIGSHKSGERNFWFGKIDELYLFKRILSKEEIVKVMNNDWFDTSVVEKKTKPEIRIYSEPGNKKLTFSGLTAFQKIVVYDMQGRIVIADTNSNTLNLDNLKAGNYSLMIQGDDNQIYNKRFVLAN